MLRYIRLYVSDAVAGVKNLTDLNGKRPLQSPHVQVLVSGNDGEPRRGRGSHWSPLEAFDGCRM